MGLFRKTINFDSVTTRGGDKGQTSLFSGQRVSKSAGSVEAIGQIDELQSLIGVVSCFLPYSALQKLLGLHDIQRDLYDSMSCLASGTDHEYYFSFPSERRVEILEQNMHFLMKSTNIPQKFVIPGEKGIKVSALLDFARTVCRRAESRMVKYIREDSKPFKVDYDDLHGIQVYLNRLSDVLFVMARYVDEINEIN